MASSSAPISNRKSTALAPVVSANNIAELPTELRVHILRMLENLSDLSRASWVCREWRMVVKDVPCKINRLKMHSLRKIVAFSIIFTSFKIKEINEPRIANEQLYQANLDLIRFPIRYDVAKLFHFKTRLIINHNKKTFFLNKTSGEIDATIEGKNLLSVLSLNDRDFLLYYKRLNTPIVHVAFSSTCEPSIDYYALPQIPDESSEGEDITEEPMLMKRKGAELDIHLQPPKKKRRNENDESDPNISFVKAFDSVSLWLINGEYYTYEFKNNTLTKLCLNDIDNIDVTDDIEIEFCSDRLFLFAKKRKSLAVFQYNTTSSTYDLISSNIFGDKSKLFDVSNDQNKMAIENFRSNELNDWDLKEINILNRNFVVVALECPVMSNRPILLSLETGKMIELNRYGLECNSPIAIWKHYLVSMLTNSNYGFLSLVNLYSNARIFLTGRDFLPGKASHISDVIVTYDNNEESLIAKIKYNDTLNNKKGEIRFEIST